MKNNKTNTTKMKKIIVAYGFPCDRQTFVATNLYLVKIFSRTIEKLEEQEKATDFSKINKPISAKAVLKYANENDKVEEIYSTTYKNIPTLIL